MAIFPTQEWIQALQDKLNNDEKYAQIAQKWEGDMLFVVDAAGNLNQPMTFYLDLWHGKCRKAFLVNNNQEITAAFSLKGPYDNYVRLLKGDMDPMQALLTRKLGVQGNMAMLMRNIPTVLDFVRCCRAITTGFI